MAGIFTLLTSLLTSCSAEPEKKVVRKPKSNPITEELVNASWSSGGGMNGGHNSSEIRKEKNGDCWVVITKKPSHDAKQVETKIKVSAKDLRQLFDHMNKHFSYKKWKDFPQSQFQALDAPTYTVSMTVKGTDGKHNYYNGFSTQDFPEVEGRAFRDIRCFVESYAAVNVKTYQFHCSDFDGSPQPATIIIDDPGLVRVETNKKYRSTVGTNTGSRFDITFTLYGRIPGKTKAHLTSLRPEGKVYYDVVVDDNFNLSVTEAK